MVFENNDDFGINSFREDVRYTMSANMIKVQIKRHNTKKEEYVQGDLMGIKTQSFPDTKEFILINLMSENSEAKRQRKEGYHGRGEIRYRCLVPHDVEINNKDIIIFPENYNYDIRTGDKFRIELGDFGP